MTITDLSSDEPRPGSTHDALMRLWYEGLTTPIYQVIHDPEDNGYEGAELRFVANDLWLCRALVRNLDTGGMSLMFDLIPTAHQGLQHLSFEAIPMA